METAGESTFSVIIPLYNKRHYVQRCLQSVAAQRLPAHEVIIVNDGSSDDSVKMVQPFLNERWRVISQTNQGPGVARNTGIAAACAPWVALLDADDYWSPEHLAELATLVTSFPQADLVSTRSTEVWSDQARSRFKLRRPRRGLGDFFRRPLSVNSSSVALRRQVVETAGGFQAASRGEDSEMWARICLNHECAFSTRRTSFYLRGVGGLMESATTQAARPTSEIRGVEDLGLAAQFLVGALAEGKVPAAKVRAVEAFLNHRISVAIHMKFVAGEVEQLPAIAALYMGELEVRERMWSAVANVEPSILRRCSAGRRTLRNLYRMVRPR